MKISNKLYGQQYWRQSHLQERPWDLAQTSALSDAHSGWEATSREACRRVEEHYEKLLELHGRRKPEKGPAACEAPAKGIINVRRG
ncbi:hypothetical protein ELH21_30865 (plasmid) [Rhizobium leguminosarum]|nr:hypothetical protein ELH21_30865 [Rhizobium leguminosarum]